MTPSISAQASSTSDGQPVRPGSLPATLTGPARPIIGLFLMGAKRVIQPAALWEQGEGKGWREPRG